VVIAEVEDEGIDQDGDDDEPILIDNQVQKDIVKRAFIIGELLTIGRDVDYVDEMGRRKMFSLMSEF
jgi:hypothetical protein